MHTIPAEILALANQRLKLRKSAAYEEADKVRQQLLELGYKVTDTSDSFALEKLETVAPNNSLQVAKIAIFGSGEIAPVSQKVHDSIFKEHQKRPLNIAIITTPAGFQPNVKVVHEEIAQFFMTNLQNYKPHVSIVYANNRTLADNPEVIAPLETADHLFIGPGSPTYAVRNLRHTLLYNMLIKKVKSGASLSIASAAALAFSKYTLPVYEIYKVGSDLYWEKGLDFFGEFGLDWTVIPHFNNQEGGSKNDTSHCYMGKARFQQLLSQLPPQEPLLRIDEHTAFSADLRSKTTETIGTGITAEFTPRSFAQVIAI